ncbi:unnamed protein product [Adineta ricciae]|uniref:F-box domain-containing protein n=1 Tax=Adineta ricciae TaxID=249248 RepID=A0A815G086_ADIRI|nr:unnamed protein product [Adineta ricciae]CAF1384372.1 unnamed protein product [Adineta ricciae]
MNRIDERRTTCLEDLPNELWVELFTFFTCFQLKSTWIQWQLNGRIIALAREALNRVAFEISSNTVTTYGECFDYFEHQHSRMAHRIKSLVFDEWVISCELTSRWLKSGSSFLPHLRQLIVFTDFTSQYVLSNITSLILLSASSLRRLVLVFNLPHTNYGAVLSQLVTHRISLHTMELIIENEIQSFYNPDFDLNTLCTRLNHWSIFPRTIRLRLSLQHIFELALLVQSDALPRVQDLHITLEDKVGYLFDWPIHRKISPSFTLCPNDLRPSQADLPELRTLHLQNISMNDVLLLTLGRFLWVQQRSLHLFYLFLYQ